MMTWTKERHDAARTRCESATARPWKWSNESDLMATLTGPDPVQDYVMGLSRDVAAGPYIGDETREHWPLHIDAEFIIYARADLPDALDEIERLEAEIAMLCQSLELVPGVCDALDAIEEENGGKR